MCKGSVLASEERVMESQGRGRHERVVWVQGRRGWLMCACKGGEGDSDEE